MNARFPGDVTDMWLTYFHKRGLQTDLSNWRGIMLSNFLANSPLTWLNYKLIPYAAKFNLIPDTQVATQRGVQTRDIVSYLSQVKCYAERSRTPIYALQRDQMKGFDYLSPQGFLRCTQCLWAFQTRLLIWIEQRKGKSGPFLEQRMALQAHLQFEA
ncbi:hypothetical protein BDZ89DRAFT_380028 [Hymenopellis radicata]|nr:hypothetical protein BDZ89DRAFT_380028 [Hymenopellis radicata]